MNEDAAAVGGGDPRRPDAAGRGPGLRQLLGRRSLVLVGLMGAGKSTIGRRLANRLGLPFKDADQEIEAAHAMSVPDIFAAYGEPYFRDGERRVIGRLLQEGPILLATGGGSYMNAETRARIAESGVSVWLKASLEVLMKRVRMRPTRPLLMTPDPQATLRRLMEERYPIYGLADITVESKDLPHDRIADQVIAALDAWLSGEKEAS